MATTTNLPAAGPVGGRRGTNRTGNSAHLWIPEFALDSGQPTWCRQRVIIEEGHNFRLSDTKTGVARVTYAFAVGQAQVPSAELPGNCFGFGAGHRIINNDDFGGRSLRGSERFERPCELGRAIPSGDYDCTERAVRHN